MPGDDTTNEISTQTFQRRNSRETRFFQTVLEPAGIRFNGFNEWDITIHDTRLLPRVMSSGTLGLGEACMDGWWDCPRLDEMVCQALVVDIENNIRRNIGYALFPLWFGLMNRQSVSRAFMVGESSITISAMIYSKR